MYYKCAAGHTQYHAWAALPHDYSNPASVSHAFSSGDQFPASYPCNQSITASCSYAYTDWETDKYATCDEDGLSHREGTCTVCGYHTTFYQTVPALGHDYERAANYLNATLTKEGIAQWVCSRDEDHVYEAYIPKRKLETVYLNGVKLPAAYVDGGVYDIRINGCSLVQSGGDAITPTSTTEPRLLH